MEPLNYFKIKCAGFNIGLEREEIILHAGENGLICIHKTDEGFVVDVYGDKDQLVDSLTVWNYELD